MMVWRWFSGGLDGAVRYMFPFSFFLFFFFRFNSKFCSNKIDIDSNIYSYLNKMHIAYFFLTTWPWARVGCSTPPSSRWQSR